MRPILLAALLTPLTSLPAQEPPARSEAYELPDLVAKLAESHHRWLPFLTRRSLSCGVYRIPKGGQDGQSPHDRDEVYYVAAGRAKLDVAGTLHDAAPGAVLFVAAGAEHRFVEVEEDLTTLVFFSESRPTRGGMAAGPRPTGQTPYDEGSERGSARIFYWFGDSSAGQLEITYGRPDWNPAYGTFLEKASGSRWRFGENFWTTLDTNIPLNIGGADLDVGQYYLVLQNHPEHGLRIVALDPQNVRERRLDAYEADETEGGVAIPLAHETTGDTAQRLTIDLAVDRSKPDHAMLTVRFGPHVLTAAIVMRP